MQANQNQERNEQVFQFQFDKFNFKKLYLSVHAVGTPYSITFRLSADAIITLYFNEYFLHFVIDTIYW